MRLHHFKFSPAQCAAIANALSAAATRWDDVADQLAVPEVAASFRQQAEEARAFASDFNRMA